MTEAELIANYAAVRARLYGPAAAAKPIPQERRLLFVARAPMIVVPPRIRKPYPDEWKCVGPVNFSLRGGAFILSLVAAKHSTNVEALRGRGRTRALVAARREAALLIDSHIHPSTTEIGRMMNRDHTSILHLLGRTAKARRLAGECE